jgi:hypothetical protein
VRRDAGHRRAWSSEQSDEWRVSLQTGITAMPAQFIRPYDAFEILMLAGGVVLIVAIAFAF